MFNNTWNRIIEWFNDRSERNQLIRHFNQSARNSFICGTSPTLLNASISKGISLYRHQFSAWMNTGFRLQALSGRPLSKEEMLFIGNVILNDTELIRRLVVLGWDTLEVHDNVGTFGCRWKLIDYAQIGVALCQENK